MSGSTRRSTCWLAIAALLAMTACASDDEEGVGTTATTAATTTAAATAPTVAAPTTSAPDTTAATTTIETAEPATTVTAPPAAAPPSGDDAIDLLEALAADDLAGRDNATSESVLAQQLLIADLSRFAQPLRPEGDTEGYLHAFAEGTNVIGIVPGSDLADEYVMIGAHYDHLERGDCRLVTSSDDICNGAVDNATGVAATMAIAEAVAAEQPRRSLIVAFWDAEEDGLLGSSAFVASPVVPLDQIVTYVNFDMQGSNLLPSLARHTVAVGAETGGTALSDLVTEATGGSALDYAMFSLIMGQGRSDHAPFAAAGVPVVFFTDSTNGCYHSADDEIAAVDTGKLTAQIDTVTELVRRLANDAPLAIEFDGDAPTTSFADAERLLDLANTGETDLAAVDQTTADAARSVIETIGAVVAAGPAAYDDHAQGAVLGAAAQLVELLTVLDCSFSTAG